MTERQSLCDARVRENVRLLPATMQNGLSRRPMRFEVPVTGLRDYWCMGCGTTIRQGEVHARGMSAGRLCRACVDGAETVEVDLPSVFSTESEAVRTLMDRVAAVDATQKAVVFAVALKDDVPHAVAKFLARCWAVEISAEDEVEYARFRTYGTVNHA